MLRESAVSSTGCRASSGLSGRLQGEPTSPPLECEPHAEADKHGPGRAIDPDQDARASPQPRRQRTREDGDGRLDQERHAGKGESEDEHVERRLLCRRGHERRQTGEVEPRELVVGLIVIFAIDDELAILGTWKTPDDAKAWAVEVGACANEFEARNSFKKIVDAYGGKLTTSNVDKVYLDFLRRQHEKLAQKQAA